MASGALRFLAGGGAASFILMVVAGCREPRLTATSECLIRDLIISPAAVVLSPGDSALIQVSSACSAESSLAVAWMSSDTVVAVVQARGARTGLLRARAPGTAVVSGLDVRQPIVAAAMAVTVSPR